MTEVDSYSKFVKAHPQLFMNTEFSDEDRNILEEIFSYKEKLLNEIKDLEDELSEVQYEMDQLDSSDSSANNNNDPSNKNANNSSLATATNNGNSNNSTNNNPKLRQMSVGKKKFNMDSKKGMEFLVSNNLVEHTTDSVAAFLFQGEGLNKSSIGVYLGEKHDFNLGVLNKFVALHAFDNKCLVDALRDFLWNFRLPGEAQKIDRMMDSFSQRFCECNPQVFVDAESCYVVSFAVIMLNTSLHNPSVKDKQTCDQFLKMCKETAKCEQLADAMLKECYVSIKKEPFKIPVDDGNDFMLTFFNPIREGWLWKQGGRYKTWKRRWFILNDGCLYYFELTADKEPRGIIPLENVNVREVDDKTKQFCFEIYSTTNDKIKACKHDSEGKVIEVGNHTVYRMSALTGEDKNEWIKKIRDCISENPLINSTNAKKKMPNINTNNINTNNNNNNK